MLEQSKWDQAISQAHNIVSHHFGTDPAIEDEAYKRIAFQVILEILLKNKAM